MFFNHGTYECVVCGKRLEVDDAKQVQSVVQGAPGRRNINVLRVNGQEIHRCETPPFPLTPWR
jgi:hypothetical protein